MEGRILDNISLVCCFYTPLEILVWILKTATRRMRYKTYALLVIYLWNKEMFVCYPISIYVIAKQIAKFKCNSRHNKQPYTMQPMTRRISL